MKWRRATLSKTVAVYHEESAWKKWGKRLAVVLILGFGLFMGLRGWHNDGRLRDYARRFTALEKNHQNLRVAFERLQQRSEKIFWENEVGAQERLQLGKELENCRSEASHLKEEVAIYRALGAKSSKPLAIHSFTVKPQGTQYRWRLTVVRLDGENPLQVKFYFQAKGLKGDQPTEMNSPKAIPPFEVKISAGIGVFEGALDLDQAVQWQSITMKVMQNNKELALASHIL